VNTLVAATATNMVLMTHNRAIARPDIQPLYCRYRINHFNLIIRALIGR